MAKKQRPNITVPSMSGLENFTSATIGSISAAIGVSEDNTKYEELDIYSIALNPNNDYREEDTPDDIEGLASSIEHSQLLHNIVVSRREDKEDILISGERRLKAHQLLDKRHKESGKYRRIHSKIYFGLTPIQEMIMLDSANLIARGRSHADEKRVRKAVTRLVGNMMTEYGMSEKDATMLVVGHTGGQTSENVIKGNLEIERELDPQLLQLLDKGTISKTDALLFVKLTEGEQRHLAEGYTNVEASMAAVRQYNKDVVHALKNSRPLPEIPKKIEAAKITSKVAKPVRSTTEENIDLLNKKGDRLLAVVRQIAKQKAFLLNHRDEFTGDDSALKAKLEDAKEELEKLVDALG